MRKWSTWQYPERYCNKILEIGSEYQLTTTYDVTMRMKSCCNDYSDIITYSSDWQ